MTQTGFQGALIEQEPTVAFDATQYSFFGDLHDEELGGALEDGLEAPPMEEGLLGALEEEIDPASLHEQQPPEDITMLGMLDDLDDSALEAAMARSLPKHMFEDDDTATNRGMGASLRSGLAQEAVATPARTLPQRQEAMLTPGSVGGSAAKPRPMTLQELEAQLQADTTPGRPQGPPGLAPMGPGGPGTPLTCTGPPRHFPHLPMQQQPPVYHGPDGRPLPPGVIPPSGYAEPRGGHAPPPHFMHPHMGLPPHPGMGPMHPPPGPHPMMHHGPPGMLPPGMGPPHTPPHHPGHMPGPPFLSGPGMPPPGHPGHPMHGPPGVHGPPMPMHGPPGLVRPPLSPPPPGVVGGPSTPLPPPPQAGARTASPHTAPHSAPPGPPRAPFMTQVQGRGPRHASPPTSWAGSAWAGPGSVMGGASSGALGSGHGRFGGDWMPSAEVEHIMRIMYQSVHAGIPYNEDYVYQAVVHKATNGRNAVSFRPEMLRSLRPDVVGLAPGSTLVKFAAVDGLGKIVLSNIKTPKVLMDLTSSASTSTKPRGISSTGALNAAGGSEAGGVVVSSRPLEQEPLLAARILIEDCHDKLLDVDDIDRCLAAAGAVHAAALPGGTPAELRERRALLAAAVTHAFRVPASPVGGPNGGGTDTDQGVFLNLTSLPKGRALLARALRVLLAAPAAGPLGALPQAPANGSNGAPPPQLARPAQLLWAVLRNIQGLFGASVQDPELKPSTLLPLVEATHRLAAAAKDALHRLSTLEELCECMCALQVGLRVFAPPEEGAPMDPMAAILPLVQVRKLPGPVSDAAPPDWLADVLLVLLQRGAHLVPDDEASAVAAEAAGTAPQHVTEWQRGRAALVGAFLRHTAALATLHTEITQLAAAQGGPPPPETLTALRNLACRQLAHQLMGCIPDAAERDNFKQRIRQLL